MFVLVLRRGPVKKRRQFFWCKMAADSDYFNGPVFIIGNPSHIFPRKLASIWRTRGLDVRIVTRKWLGDPVMEDGTPIVQSAECEPWILTKLLSLLRRLLVGMEALVCLVQKKRFLWAMASEENYRPRIAQHVVDALSISRYVRKMRPAFVFGMEVYTSGFSTALCRGVPRIVMPWGGDIFMYAETTSLSAHVVSYALRHVDLVCPTAESCVDYITNHFGVDSNKVRAMSWGVDRRVHFRADRERRKNICKHYGIDSEACIVLNSRRFNKAWGAEVALESFMRVAVREQGTHFIMLGGKGVAERVHKAMALVVKAGLRERFTFFDHEISLTECSDLMSIADVFTSLTQFRDMKSHTVPQSAAGGGAPVLSDQPEHRHMTKYGFRATFVNPRNVEEVAQAVLVYVRDPELRRMVQSANSQYLRDHEDPDKRMIALLKLIANACTTYHQRGV